MCLLIDANRGYCLFDTVDGTLGKALRTKLLRGDVRIATGGKNMDELVASKPKEFVKLILEFNKSGWLLIYNRQKIEALAEKLDRADNLRSNDSHNLALAILAGAHVIISNDNDFAADFRDPKIVPIRKNCRKSVLRNDECAARVRALNCCGCHP